MTAPTSPVNTPNNSFIIDYYTTAPSNCNTEIRNVEARHLRLSSKNIFLYATPGKVFRWRHSVLFRRQSLVRFRIGIASLYNGTHLRTYKNFHQLPLHTTTTVDNKNFKALDTRANTRK
jgi:hypothetical protein